MLIPNMLFYCIMNEKGISCIPLINKRKVGQQRRWDNISPEKRKEFSEMRSRIQKEVEKDPRIKAIHAKTFKRVVQNYWDNVSEEQKTEHCKKMSKGMKKAWNEADDSFGPKIANEKNVQIFKKLEEIAPRINDYCGVITSSELASL